LNEWVVDASVLVKWFKPDDEDLVENAERLRAAYTRGDLRFAAPPLLPIELLNIAARRARWDAPRVQWLARALLALRFEIQQPDLAVVAVWCNRGLTAYDACYVALAQERNTVVVTDDDEMIAIGGRFVRALADA
jgi:predicted nucleic acid-binding protein